MTKVKLLLTQRTNFISSGHVYITDDINCGSRAIIKKISFKCNNELSLSEQFMNSEIVIGISSVHDGVLYTHPKKISLMTILLKHLLTTKKEPIIDNKIKLYPDLIIEKKKKQITNIVVNSNIDFVSISIVLKIFDDIRIVQHYSIFNCDYYADYDLYEPKFIIYTFSTQDSIKDIDIKKVTGSMMESSSMHIELDVEQCAKLGQYDLYIVRTSDMSTISLEELVRIIKTDDIDNVMSCSIEGLTIPIGCKMYLVL
jgi:hypothetical protein